MLSNWFTDLDFPTRMAVISISLGLILTVGVFLMARRIIGASNRPSATLPPLPGGEQECLRDPFVYGCSDEKRVGLRRRGTTTDVMISDAEQKARPWFGIVADRSVGGLRLIQENALAVGTVISVRPGRASEGTPWTQIEVRHCRKTANGWELGCSFIRTPASTLLMDFG